VHRRLRHRTARGWAVAVAVLAASAALLVLAGRAAMIDALLRTMLYPAPAVRVPERPPPPLVAVELRPASGEQVTAWARPVRPGADPGRPAAVFFHGNGENLETMRQAGLFPLLDGLDVPYLASDYPGYGRSSGEPSEAGLMATGEAALARLAVDAPGRPLVVAGWSLGAAVAVELAARHPRQVAGVVLLSPWSRLADVAAVHFPGPLVRPALGHRYDSLAAARRVEVPALVVHGADDRIIPVEQGRRVAEALAGEVRWVPVAGAGHNDLLARQQVWDELRRFIDSL